MPTYKKEVNLFISIKMFNFHPKIQIYDRMSGQYIGEVCTKMSTLVNDVKELEYTYTISNVNLYGNTNYLSKFAKELQDYSKYNNMKVTIIEK